MLRMQRKNCPRLQSWREFFMLGIDIEKERLESQHTSGARQKRMGIAGNVLR